jgi:2,3-bisphosphoglycerate-dependent phosphoglycerate mutase
MQNLSGRKNFHLTLVRHGESLWNEKNLFTGWRNVNLTEKGVKEAMNGGQLLKAKGVSYSRGYTSFLLRAQRTYSLIVEQLAEGTRKRF